MNKKSTRDRKRDKFERESKIKKVVKNKEKYRKRFPDEDED